MICLSVFFSLLPAQLSADKQKTLDSLNNSLKIYQGKNDSQKSAETFYSLAKFHDQNDDIEKSNSMLEKTIALAEKTKDKKLLGQALNYLASNYSYQGNSDQSILIFRKAFDTFSQIKDSSKMSKVLINLGSEYVEKGNVKKALETELLALKIKESCKDSSQIAYYYEQIAEIYFSMKNFEKWKEFVMTAHRLAQNPNYTSFLTTIKILNELAEVNRRESRIYEAEKIYNKIYEMCLKEDYIKGQSVALTNLVPVYIQQAKLPQAEKAANKSLEIDLKLNRISGIIYNYIQLGKLNRILKNPVKAAGFAEKGTMLAKQYNYADDIITGLNELYLISKDLGQTAKALKYFEEYGELKDSLYSRDINKQMAEMQTKFETEKKEQKIKLLDNENKLQKSRLQNQQILIAGIIIVTIFIITAWYFVFKQRRTRSELKMLQAEQKMLRSQMNPHFIFNSLNAIQNFLLKNDTYKTADYLSDFSSLMRLILTSSRSDYINLENEEKIIRYYLELQKIRFNNSFDFTVNFSENTDKENRLIPPMLLQPFIENAVEHGIRSLTSGGKIDINFEEKNDNLFISIIDNGVGISSGNAGKRSEHISYSTKITEERIENINKIYNTSIKMIISDLTGTNETGTKVEFIIPVDINYLKG